MGLDVVRKIRDKVNQISEIDNEIKHLKKLLPLPTLQFEVHLAEHCNLNCMGCDNFSCIAEPSLLDLVQYNKDLKRLSYLCQGEAKRIHLMGGEPLLHPEAAKAAVITRERFPYALIDIYTNGVLLLKQTEEFWFTLKDANIGIMVTKYPIAFDYEKAEELANNHGVNYQYCTVPEHEKELFHFTLDLSGQQNEVDSFLKCHRANACIALKDGKLFTCSLVANIGHFNKCFHENLPVTDRNYINIYEAESLQEILEFLAKPIPFCRFCNMNADTVTYKWQQTKREKTEWT